jgi:D-aminoacyl-tRNA deacylase
MRVVVQRSKAAEVTIDEQSIGRITQGLVLLVAVTHEDKEADAIYLAEKIAGLRIFEDEAGKMNFSVTDIKGQILSISQFTLYGDCRNGRRPNFMAAAKPEPAEVLYNFFNNRLRTLGLQVESGAFGKMMDVTLTNWGPVTLILDSK